MNASFYWSVFLETGAPEAYLLYRSAASEQADSAGRMPCS